MSNQLSVKKMVHGVAGLLEGSHNQIRSLLNSKGGAPKVSRVAITAVNSTAYSLPVAGQTLSYTSDSSATTEEIRDGLVASFRANEDLVDLVAINPDGADGILVTGLESGFDFALDDSDVNLAETVQQAAVATEVIPFGYGVVQGPSADEMKLPDTLGQALLGICVREAGSDDPSDDVGGVGALKQGNVLHHGLCQAYAEEDIAVGVPVFMQKTGASAGAFRTDADGGSAEAVPDVVSRGMISAGVVLLSASIK